MFLRLMERPQAWTPHLSALSPPTLVNELWAFHTSDHDSYTLMCQNLVPSSRSLDYRQLPKPDFTDITDRPGRLNKLAHTHTLYKFEFCNNGPARVWCEAASYRTAAQIDTDVYFTHPWTGFNGQESCLGYRDKETKLWVTSIVNEHSEATLPVILKGFDCSATVVDVSLDWSVAHIKYLFKLRNGCPVKMFRLIHGGKDMNDGHSLQRYKLQRYSVMRVVGRLLGC